MYLEAWEDNPGMYYIIDDKKFKNTIAVLEGDGIISRGASINKIVVTDEIDALLNRFNYLKPTQICSEELLAELRLFLVAPDAYKYMPRCGTSREALRFLRLTESSTKLEPIK